MSEIIHEDAPLTSGRLLARNTIWHFFGQVIPLVVALVSIPILVRSLGAEKFGVLTLAWLVIGYFSFVDMGLGRALTKLVSEKLGEGKDDEVAPLIWTAMGLLLVPGVIGATFLAVFSPRLVHSLIKIPIELQEETLNAFYMFAFAIPVIVGTEALIGVLMAKQRHDLVNSVKIPMGILMFLGPVLILPFSHSLLVIISALIAVRILAMLAHLFNCFRVYPSMRHDRRLQKENLSSLVRFGSWMTVNNVIDPFMVKVDRFLIGAFVSMTAVAYYATPYEAVTKLWVVPTAIISVLYPAFAASFARDPERMAFLYYRGIKYILLVLFPLALIIVTLASEGLGLWLGPEFAENSTLVLQLLAMGVFLNSLSQVPFVLVQGTGRPDITAKLHLVELPLYLGLLWWAIKTGGIQGVAVAWLGRSTIDFLILVGLTHRLHFRSQRLLKPRTILISVVVVVSFVLAMLLTGMIVKLIFLLTVALLFVTGSWSLLLSQEERRFIRNRLRKPVENGASSRI